MKIGILTFHRSINYGAVTQCYALSAQIQKDFPDDQVEVIDYVPEWRVRTYKPTLWRFIFGTVRQSNGLVLNLKIVLQKGLELIRHPSHFRLLKTRYQAFQRSLKCLPLSRETYRENSAEAFRDHVKGKYDLIIVGSDCVWEWSTIPLPSPYYLGGDFGAVKASFAASAGTDDYKLLTEKDRNQLQKAIGEFSYVGLRDTSTEYVVKGLCPGKTFYHNCDPTTFLDIRTLENERKRVRDRFIKAGVDFEKPMICIMGNEKIGKLAHDIFQDSVQYIGVYVPNRYCDVFLADLEVLEWAAVFGFCRLTFTTFFHGTMLSLANHVPVLSFDYLPETDQQMTKLHELYIRLGLPRFYQRGKNEYGADDVEKIGKIAQELVSAPPTQQIADALKKEAEHYYTLKDFIGSLHKEMDKSANETTV